MSEALPELLGERGVSLREVARRAGIDVAHLSRVVNGEKPAGGELAGRIAEALELERDYFPEYRLAAVEEAVRRDGTLRDRIYAEL